MPSNQVAFVRARLDDDEAAAKAWLPIGNPTDAQREHVARHDPGQVLREVDVWRRILLEYQTAGLDTSVPAERITGFRYALGFAIKAKAAVYRDHPDYDPDAPLSEMSDTRS